MSRRKKSPDLANVELNMTPMIDVVFNLIIFFMVITDMSQTELEYLILPKADLAEEDKGEDTERLIVNIVDAKNPNNIGRVDQNLPPIMFKGRQYPNLDELRRAMRLVSDPMLYPEKEKPNGQKLDPAGFVGGKPVYPSRKALLIRCDQGQMFGWVQTVMQLCTFMPGRPMSRELRESPLIYKVEVAVAEKELPK